MNSKQPASKLDEIIKKTVDVINSSKAEISEISLSARKECKWLEDEISAVKVQLEELAFTIQQLENDLKVSKRKLANVSSDFEKYSEQEVKKAYEDADEIRMQLAVARTKEKFYIQRRNELEIQLRDAKQTVKRAEKLISQVSVAISFLTDDMIELTNHMEDMEQKQYLALRIIRAQEDERQHVAREIHDGPAQIMSNVVLKAEICERLLDVDMNRARDELKSLKQTVRDCLQDVRSIIYNLRPMSLDDLGLIPTIKRYVDKFKENTGLEVTIKTNGSLDNLKSVVSLTVFRIVQEALSNVKKHAKATHVLINMERVNKTLRVLISDDGVGFDPDNVRRLNNDCNSGFGLVSMRERVQLLGGELIIKSKPGAGCRLLFSIPIEIEKGDKNE